MEAQILEYLLDYGYFFLFILGIFGIVGIPVPEESLFVYVGILCRNGQLSFPLTLLSITIGSLTGMYIGYFLGKYIGKPLIRRYGRYIGITEERWELFVGKWNMRKAIILGFFVPGIRQINPYFSGISAFPFILFSLLSVIGALAWVSFYMFAGFMISKYIYIKPFYLSLAGGILFVLFIIQFVIKWKKYSSTSETSD